MTRRVLLTGASGFLGRHAIAPLLARGFEVHAAARRPPSATGVVPHALDLLDPAASARLVRAIAPTHLLHLAWDVTPGRYWTAPENLDWVAASLHLYRAFAMAGGKRAAIAGTCAEYDWSAAALEEDAPCRPATLYGTAKHALHELLAKAAAQDGIGLAWGRVFFLYGPHEHPSRLVPSVIAPILRGEPALVGDGRARRDFMHVADVATALVAALDSELTGPVNIASGQCSPILGVVEAIARQLGRPDLLRVGARATPVGEPLELACSGRVLAGLGFRQRFGLENGLIDTIAWWREHNPAA